MPVGKDGWFEASAPIEVENGLRARGRRGTIGEQWWSRRFIDILERVCAPGRLSRGRAYARKGQVLGLDLGPGLVVSRVQGSRPEPYRVSVRIDAYDEAAWGRVQDALSRQALYRAKLLAGEMPSEIVEVFDALGLPLFPAELDMDCSCPDWGVPCKHLSAVLYLLAEAFDDDPFLVLAWRGRARDELLDALRAPTGVASEKSAVTGLAGEKGALAAAASDGDAEDDPLSVPDEPFEDRLTDFYTPSTPLARLRPRPGTPKAPPELLLRVLEPPTVKIRHIPLLDILRPAYRELGPRP
ncbi:SWIM zinc finger family protein [Sphaerisporangium sp. TRM90804]|uniref:SWIM zinc finger family protein n=1 Tax=Sphaerisporangium sp. TRM90804 TaxID=3031113 RepID=UPI0024499D1B|nr:SWIM zinc finger family protein [Sphaerisporangium sp. TRM90804]MDH2424534.1 SWIM zinc finger family protein [Sphaerisporangium sp. TRM90804]